MKNFENLINTKLYVITGMLAVCVLIIINELTINIKSVSFKEWKYKIKEDNCIYYTNEINSNKYGTISFPIGTNEIVTVTDKHSITRLK